MTEDTPSAVPDEPVDMGYLSLPAEVQQAIEARVDRVEPGGLMRCCLETLDGHYPDGPAAKAGEGEVLPCKHCPSSMIFSGGFWRWNHD